MNFTPKQNCVSFDSKFLKDLEKVDIDLGDLICINDNCYAYGYIEYEESFDNLGNPITSCWLEMNKCGCSCYPLCNETVFCDGQYFKVVSNRKRATDSCYWKWDLAPLDQGKCKSCG